MNKFFSRILEELILIFKSPLILFPHDLFAGVPSHPQMNSPKSSIVASKLRKTLEVIFFSFVFILIPVIAFTIITSRTSALFGFQSFIVVSGSMNPSMPVGSVVYTQKGNPVNIGDVITFERGNVKITHRVIDITDKSGKSVSSLVSPIPGTPNPAEIFYKTKGDANNSADSELVPAGKVVGKAFVNMPAIGKISSYLKTLPGFLILIVGPTLIFVGFELWNIKKEIEKQTEKKVLERMRMV